MRENEGGMGSREMGEEFGGENSWEEKGEEPVREYVRGGLRLVGVRGCGRAMPNGKPIG